MRIPRWSLVLVLALAALLTAHTAALLAQDEDVAAERARVAAAELKKAVERGKALWSKKLGKKSCAQCHEDPDKPKLDMTKRTWSYPAYSRRKKAVVTLHQKINEMLEYQSKAKGKLEKDSKEIADLAAYVTSLRSK